MSDNQWTTGAGNQSSPQNNAHETDPQIQPSSSESWQSASDDWADAQTQNVTQDWNQQPQANTQDWNQQPQANTQDWNQQPQANTQDWNQQPQANTQDWNQQPQQWDANVEHSQANIAQDWNQQSQASAQDWNQQSQASAQDWNQQPQQQWNQQPQGGAGWQQQGQQWQNTPAAGSVGALFDFKFSRKIVPSALGPTYMVIVIILAVLALFNIINVISTDHLTGMFVLNTVIGQVGWFMIWVALVRVAFEAAAAVVQHYEDKK